MLAIVAKKNPLNINRLFNQFQLLFGGGLMSFKRMVDGGKRLDTDLVKNIFTQVILVRCCKKSWHALSEL